ncbi:MAG: DNA repair protein RadC [Deltaproteobacteria bacterium]|nr:DNA repair protein RadC [Deltaproteobacteria bacterium]
MHREEWQKKGAGHRQRLRDKFIRQGMDSFSDNEVLELLLTFGTPQKDCKEPARALLKKFTSLAEVLEKPPDELQQVKGVGPKNAFAIHFIQGVARRYLQQRLINKNYLHSSREVADYLLHAMRDLRREILTVIFLDASHAIIATEVAAEGTLTRNTVYPRELLKMALEHHAAAVIIAHNHPSGNPAPSAADRHLTRSLFLALSLVDIKLLDHFIVAGTAAPYSFADNGLMTDISEECANIWKTRR